MRIPALLRFIRSSKRTVCPGVLILGGCLLVRVTGAQTLTYNLVDLGTAGGNQSGAHSINDAGQVVGEADLASGYNRGVLWQVSGSSFSPGVDLGVLGGAATSQSSASSLNNAGQIVGNSLIVGDVKTHPVLWTISGSGITITDLGDLGGGIGDPVLLNDAGLIVGSANLPGNYGVQHATTWNANAPAPTCRDLGVLGGTNSGALAVNRAGQIVGTSDVNYNGGTPSHAAMWTVDASGNVLGTDLGTLGGPYSEAKAINNLGQATGWSYAESNGTIRATVWNTVGGNVTRTNLGTLDTPANPAFCSSQAFGINDAGQVVGFSDLNNGDQRHLFLYTASTGMQDLTKALIANPAPSLITLSSAGRPINNWGQIVASANYTVNGYVRGHAVVLNPTTPLTSVTGATLDCKIIAGKFYQSVPAFKDPTDTRVNPNVFQLLGGTVGYGDPGSTYGKNREVVITAQANPSVAPILGNAFNFQGTGGDTVVVQIAYDKAKAPTLFGMEANARLGWYNGAYWANAVDGNRPNSGPDGGFAGYRAFNAATDVLPGTHGVDLSSHTAWAVVNHGGVFGVILNPELLRQTRSFTHDAKASTLTVDAFTGHIYQLQQASALTPGGEGFSDLGVSRNGTTGSILSFTDANVPTSQRFYRIKVTP